MIAIGNGANIFTRFSLNLPLEEKSKNIRENKTRRRNFQKRKSFKNDSKGDKRRREENKQIKTIKQQNRI